MFTRPGRLYRECKAGCRNIWRALTCNQLSYRRESSTRFKMQSPCITEIYVVGPSSTGKSTLCDELARELALQAPAYISEVARTVMRSEGFTRADVGKIEMQKAIMVAQLRREVEARLALANYEGRTVLLSDRSAVDPIVYTELTSASKHEAIQRRRSLVDSPEFKHALPIYQQSVFILLAPVPQWLVDDGIRTMELQSETMELFRQTLDELGIQYAVIGSDIRGLEDRVRLIVRMAKL
jgi:nicotinamide riboside kinase